MAQCLLDGTASLGRTGVDTGGITPVMSCSELEAAQLLDVRYPTCSGTEAVVGINPCASGSWRIWPGLRGLRRCPLPGLECQLLTAPSSPSARPGRALDADPNG